MDLGSSLAEPQKRIEDPDFSVTEIDTGGGPEVVLIQRK
jgi:hypothetical protein